MAYENVLTEVRDRVGIVTLNRPDALNALNGRLGSELREAIVAYDDDLAIGAIVLTGAGRAFCTGADVKGWNRALDGEPAQRRPAPAETWAQLLKRVKPIVCAYNGDAIGAGLTLTLAADYKLAGETARFSMRFARMGIAPEIESSRLLVALVGLTNAMPLMLTGDIIDAQRALDLGLVNEVVDNDMLLDRAVDVAAHVAEIHPDTTRTIKRLVHENVFEPDAAEVVRRESAAIAYLAQRPSYREAVKAFVEKRKPDFWSGS